MNSLSRLTGWGSIDAAPSHNKIGYRQRNGYSCGYFCAKAMINTLGNKDDKNLVKSLKLTQDGVRQTHLISTLRSRGVTASIYRNLSRYSIKDIIDSGKYIIVYHHHFEHWLVLGDIKDDLVAFYDPEGLWLFDFVSSINWSLKGFGIVCGSK